jgi:hypothetical protein
MKIKKFGKINKILFPAVFTALIVNVAPLKARVTGNECKKVFAPTNKGTIIEHCKVRPLPPPSQPWVKKPKSCIYYNCVRYVY